MFIFALAYLVIVAPNRGAVAAGYYGGIYTLMATFVWSVVVISLLFFVYKDADEKFGSGCFWGIFVVLFDIIGFCVYLTLRHVFTHGTAKGKTVINRESTQLNQIRSQQFYNLYDARLVATKRRDNEIEDLISSSNLKAAYELSLHKLETESDLQTIQLLSIYKDVLKEELESKNRQVREDEWY